ncbi:MAG: hypothetical protein V1847_00840, partial [Candidatus Diapherotrites archaeon]
MVAFFRKWRVWRRESQPMRDQLKRVNKQIAQLRREIKKTGNAVWSGGISRPEFAQPRQLAPAEQEHK